MKTKLDSHIESIEERVLQMPLDWTAQSREAGEYFRHLAVSRANGLQLIVHAYHVAEVDDEFPDDAKEFLTVAIYDHLRGFLLASSFGIDDSSAALLLLNRIINEEVFTEVETHDGEWAGSRTEFAAKENPLPPNAFRRSWKGTYDEK